MIRESIKVVKKIEEVYSIDFELIDIQGGGEYYLFTGKEWEDGSFEICRDEADAILLGAVGWPEANLPDGNIAGAGIVFGLRFGLDLYANVRPTKLYEGITHKIHGQSRRVWEQVDLVTVRENTEGLYTPIRGSLIRGGSEELAIDTSVTTHKGAQRVIEFGFEISSHRDGALKDGKKRVTCVDKANVLQGSRLFRSVFDTVAERYGHIEKDYAYIDAYLQWLIRDPDYFDVIVTDNMFGDISSDMAAVLGGSLGMAPSANIGDNHALFEPIHGSAPKHAGKDKANPMGAILSTSMMMDYLGRKYNNEKLVKAGVEIETAVKDTITEGKFLTYDLGGNTRCSEVGNAITRKITNS